MYGTYRQLNIDRRSLSPEIQLYNRPLSPENLDKMHSLGKLSSISHIIK